MRAGGINWLAVLAAAVTSYVIGFLIYGIIIPEEKFLAMSGMTEEQMAVAQSRMAFGVLMPIATAVFLAILFKWGGVDSAAGGGQWGLVVALASAVPTVWYGWVYGGLPAGMTLIDTGHLLLAHIIAGAILGGWR
jgi:hypothetical protein